MDNKKEKARPKLEVIISKRFIFPKSVIENYDHARNLAIQEFTEQVTSFVKNHENGNLTDNLEIQTQEYQVYKFRENVEENIGISLNYNNCLKDLVISEMEKKYGSKFNPEDSPKLFVFEEPILSDDKETIIREAEWYMHPEIEKEYNNLKRYFSTILKKSNHN